MSLVFTSRTHFGGLHQLESKRKISGFSPKTRLGRGAKHVIVGGGLAKKATIVISLVDESCESTPEEIRKEILQELSNGRIKIPWFRKVERITIA